MKKLLYLFVILAIVNILNAQKLTETLPIDPDLIKGKLANGLTYYIRSNHKPKNRAFLYLVENVGSVFEDDDQLGLAHFCEHMAFNGTRDFPKHKLIEFLESIGMKFGADLNAYTSFDETVYMMEVPLDKPQNIDTALHILYNWAWLVSYQDSEIEAERGIIYEEWRLGRGAKERLTRKTFPIILYGSKYAERLPIGKPEIFNNCPTDNLKRFYKKWYKPDLQAVIIVGDFDPKQIQQKVIKLFSTIPTRTDTLKHKYPEIPTHQDTKIVVATDKEQPYNIVQIYIKHPLRYTRTYQDLKRDITDELILRMINQRLKEKITSPQNPYLVAMTWFGHFLGKSEVFAIYGISKNNKIPQTVEQLLSELKRAKKYGFVSTELQRAKKSLLKDIEKQYKERNTTKSDYFISLYHNNFSIAQTPIMSFEQQLAAYKNLLQQITMQDIWQELNYLITEQNRVIVVEAPEKENISVPSENEIKQIIQKVKNADIQPYKDIKIADKLIDHKIKNGKIKKTMKDKETGSTIWYLSNGAKVIIKPTDFKADQILFTAISKGGYSLYHKEQLINARLADEFITNSGIGKLSQKELDKFMQDKNFSISPFIDLYFEGINGITTVNDLETFLQLVYLYFTQPRYDTTEYTATLNQLKTIYQTRSLNPENIWYDSLQQVIYNRSIYQKPLSVQDLQKIDFQQVYKIYKERFNNAADFIFIFVGNIDTQKDKKLILKYIGGLPSTNKTENYIIRNVSIPVGKKEEVAVKEASEPKSQSLMFFTGKYDGSIEQALLIKGIAMIFTDTLLKRIRESEALTYSISAYPRFSYSEGDKYAITVFFSCDPDTLQYVKKEIISIANALKNNGTITEQDLQKTKQKLIKEYETKLQENNYWKNVIKLKDIYQIQEITDLAQLKQIIDDMTINTLQQAAKNFLDTQNYLLIYLTQKQK